MYANLNVRTTSAAAAIAFLYRCEKRSSYCQPRELLDTGTVCKGHVNVSVPGETHDFTAAAIYLDKHCLKQRRGLAWQPPPERYPPDGSPG